jgi:hypothetical protein
MSGFKAVAAVKCKGCQKTVYPMDGQINLDGTVYHKPCAKCADCNCQITLSNFSKNESNDQTLLLCKIHYFKRFHEGGSYIGGEKYAKMQTREINAEKRSSLTTVPVKPQTDPEASNSSSTQVTTTSDSTESNSNVESVPAVEAPAGN